MIDRTSLWRRLDRLRNDGIHVSQDSVPWSPPPTFWSVCEIENSMDPSRRSGLIAAGRGVVVEVVTDE